MLITSMNSSASSLEKRHCQQREDDYTVRGSAGSYRTRLHLNASTTGEQSLFIAVGAPGAVCLSLRVMQFLITLEVPILR